MFYTTSYYEEERQSQRLKLKGDKEVAQEQLDKLVTGQSLCVRLRIFFFILFMRVWKYIN